MEKLELFKTYNGIVKKYIVMAVTIQDLLNDPRYKDNKSLMLLAKPDVVPPKQRKKKKQKSTRQLIVDLQKDVKSIIEKLNYHEQLFKLHGWIK